MAMTKKEKAVAEARTAITQALTKFSDKSGAPKLTVRISGELRCPHCNSVLKYSPQGTFAHPDTDFNNCQFAGKTFKAPTLHLEEL